MQQDSWLAQLASSVAAARAERPLAELLKQRLRPADFEKHIMQASSLEVIRKMQLYMRSSKLIFQGKKKRESKNHAVVVGMNRMTLLRYALSARVWQIL